MAFGANILAAARALVGHIMIPVSIVTDWVVACSDLTEYDGASNGTAIVNPFSIARAELHWLEMRGQGTTVLISMKYPSGASISTQVVVQPIGKDGNGIPQPLYDSARSNYLTLTAAATDLEEVDGDYKFTVPVEVDAEGCTEVLVPIKTALAGTGITGAEILVRTK